MADYLAGKEGYVDVAGQTVHITAWTFNTTEDSEDVTNTGTAGYDVSVGTIKHGEGTFDAVWDADAIPTDDPPGLTVGAEPDYIRLYIGDSGDYFNLDNVRITSLNVTSEVRGTIKFSCGFRTIGSWDEPT